MGKITLLTFFLDACNFGLFSRNSATFFFNLYFQSFSNLRLLIAHFLKTKSSWMDSVMTEATPLSSVNPLNSISTLRMSSMVFSIVQKSPEFLNELKLESSLTCSTSSTYSTSSTSLVVHTLRVGKNGQFCGLLSMPSNPS